MPKAKQTAINVVLNIISFLISFGINFFLTPYIVGKLGSDVYSFIPIANNMITFINIFALSLNSMGARFITVELATKEEKEASRDFNSLLVGNIVLSILLTIPLLIVIVNIDKILNIPVDILKHVQIMFMLVLINAFITLIMNVFNIATFYKNRLDISAKISIKATLIKLIVIALLFYIFKPKIYFIAIATLIYTIYSLLKNISVYKKIMPEVSINIRLANLNSTKKLLRSGIWNSISQVGSFLIQTIDLALINILLGAKIGGTYSIVKTIPLLIQSLVVVIVNAFLPNITKYYAKGDKENLKSEINVSLKFMCLTLTLPISFMLVFGNEFFNLWIPTENTKHLAILSCIYLKPLIITTSINIVYNIYTVTNKVKIPAIVSVLCGILQVVGVIWLVKYKQVRLLGVVIFISSLSILRNLLFAPIYAARCLKFKWNTFYKYILEGILCSLTMICFCMIFKITFDINTWFKLFLVACFTSFITIVINSLVILNKSDKVHIYGIVKKKLKSILKNIKKKYFYIRWKIYKYVCTLKNEKGYILFCTPTHGNIGDHAIAISEIEFLKDNNIKVLEIYSDDTNEYVDILKDDIPSSYCILIHGGGFMGDLWYKEELRLRSVVNNFANNKIIIFPQSIYYSDTENGKKAFEESVKIYNNHHDLIICAREKKSYDVMKKMYNCKIFLLPDLVFRLNIIKRANYGEFPMLCFRDDCEVIIKDDEKCTLINEIKSNYPNTKQIDTVKNVKIYKRNRKKYVNSFVKQMANCRFILTDRLHAMIFAYLLDIPCIVFDNISGKIKSTYLTWLPQCKSIKFTNSNEDMEKIYINQETSCDKLEKENIKKAFEILEKILKEV